MKEWDAGQYLRFKQERTQPAIDLAARIPLTGHLRILDAGADRGTAPAFWHSGFRRRIFSAWIRRRR